VNVADSGFVACGDDAGIRLQATQKHDVRVDLGITAAPAVRAPLTAGIDVKRPLRIAAVDVAVGRKAGLPWRRL